MPVWYVIEGYDGQDVLAQRLQARPEHLARLHALRDEGRLLLAGPCPAVDSEDPGPAGFSGSVVIAQFESLPQRADHGRHSLSFRVAPRRETWPGEALPHAPPGQSPAARGRGGRSSPRSYSNTGSLRCLAHLLTRSNVLRGSDIPAARPEP
jgi:uncharacterized protein YciI